MSGPRRGRGRPSSYDPKRVLPVVRAMAKLGATDVEVAAALGVSLGTVELWARTHPDFLRALKPPKRVADDRVERSLYSRATGYSYDSEELIPYDHIEVKKDEHGKETIIVKEKRVLRAPIVKHVPPSDTACIFWLKNRRKDRWRDFKATELSTAPGRPLEVAHNAPGEAELIGAYYQRLSRQQGEPANGGAPGANPSAAPGVGKGGQGTDGPASGPKADQS